MLALLALFLMYFQTHTLAAFTISISLIFLRYIPPLLWGKSGHLQTALYGKMGRVKTPTPCGVRKFLPMPDGATATFDLFEALGEHRTGGNTPSSVIVIT